MAVPAAAATSHTSSPPLSASSAVIHVAVLREAYCCLWFFVRNRRETVQLPENYALFCVHLWLMSRRDPLPGGTKQVGSSLLYRHAGVSR